MCAYTNMSVAYILNYQEVLQNQSTIISVCGLNGLLQISKTSIYSLQLGLFVSVRLADSDSFF
jgi:Na+-translocating ferredoxin:NAD+ oxidoreductase RnfE subunit